MANLNQLLVEKPWVRDYLYFDPDLQETDIVFEENLKKFNFFIQSMEDVYANKTYLLQQYNLPDYIAVIELLSVFKVTTATGKITKVQEKVFFNRLSDFIQVELEKGNTLDTIFEDKDALALSRLYQVTDENWTKKYLTWILYELGAINKTKSPDIFGANDSAFTTYDYLKSVSNGKWRPQMHFSGKI